MAEITREHERFLIRAAKWIKAHRKSYCPITAIKHVPNWRTIFRDLENLKLVQEYKEGETIIITGDGWIYLSERCPELTRRRTGTIRLE